MSITARSYLTAGVAAVDAGAIALPPVLPVPHHATAPERAVGTLAVELAAAIDPITPRVDTFEFAFSNIQKLGARYAQQQLPLLNAVGANQIKSVGGPAKSASSRGMAKSAAARGVR